MAGNPFAGAVDPAIAAVGPGPVLNDYGRDARVVRVNPVPPFIGRLLSRAALNAALLLENARRILGEFWKIDLPNISKIDKIYVTAPGVRKLKDHPQLGPYARAVEIAGMNAYRQASDLVESYINYIKLYKADGSPYGDPRALLYATDDLLENTLIYVVLNYKKNVLKTEFLNLARNLGIHVRNANSQVNTTGLFGRRIEPIPIELIEAINNVIGENKDKAREFFRLEQGVLAGKKSTMPYISGTDKANTPEEFDAIMGPVIDSYNIIIANKAAGLPDDRVSAGILKLRLSKSMGHKDADGITSLMALHQGGPVVSTFPVGEEATEDDGDELEEYGDNNNGGNNDGGNNGGNNDGGNNDGGEEMGDNGAGAGNLYPRGGNRRKSKRRTVKSSKRKSNKTKSTKNKSTKRR